MNPPAKTILVVDDEVAAAEALALILEDEGYRVFTASNGRLGLERAIEVLPDLVVLDLMMPIMDGAEMGRHLRTGVAGLAVKIIMNSALNEDTTRQRFTDYDVFLRKPYVIEQLLKSVRELLG